MEILARGLLGRCAHRRAAEVPRVASETAPIRFRCTAEKDVKELALRLKLSHVVIAIAQVGWLNTLCYSTLIIKKESKEWLEVVLTEHFKFTVDINVVI